MLRRGSTVHRLIRPAAASAFAVTFALALAVAVAIALGGCQAAPQAAPQAAASATRPAVPQAAAPFPVLVHLPGIAGEMPIDRGLVRNLVKAGVAPGGTIVDWTGRDRGLGALLNARRHDAQADEIAKLIEAVARRTPGVPIVLVAHSAGTGIAVNALERLPPGVTVRTLVLLASALSPDYDLTTALAHVDGRCLSFYSEYDKYVLGAGTRAMGTYDGEHTDAAGYVGFRVPKRYQAESKVYGAKLLQFAYRPEWAELGYGGDHIGITAGPFVRQVLAPLIADDGRGKARKSPSALEGVTP